MQRPGDPVGVLGGLNLERWEQQLIAVGKSTCRDTVGVIHHVNIVHLVVVEDMPMIVDYHCQH